MNRTTTRRARPAQPAVQIRMSRDENVILILIDATIDILFIIAQRINTHTHAPDLKMFMTHVRRVPINHTRDSIRHGTRRPPHEDTSP